MPPLKPPCEIFNHTLLLSSELTVTWWPADLEFLETWKSQGILWHLKNVREFYEVRKSQGILT